MSRIWSAKSLQVRATLDTRLEWLVDELLKYTDISLTYGFRNEREQNELFSQGHSKLKWPKSKHNIFKSHAVDVQPYPYPDNENDLRAALGYIAGLAMILSKQHGFSLRWGGDWNRNGDVTDNGFDDLYHLEIYDAQGSSR